MISEMKLETLNSMEMKNKKNKDYVRLDDGDHWFTKLPDGWFYRGKFMKTRECFKFLEEAGIVGSQNFPNGVWTYRERVYTSLQEIYDWNEDDFESYNYLKYHWHEFEITHTLYTCRLYWFCDYFGDCVCENDMESALQNFRNDVDWETFEDSENLEVNYFEDSTDKEIIDYLSHSIKDRIKILKDYQRTE